MDSDLGQPANFNESSDDMHSDHSLARRVADKGPRLSSSVKTLDSFADIPDSGSARMKAISSNPFSLPKDVIDALLKQDYVGLPVLRYD